MNSMAKSKWLQHSVDDIVNNRLPVKKLFYSEYSDEQMQSAGSYENVFLSQMVDCLCRLS